MDVSLNRHGFAIQSGLVLHDQTDARKFVRVRKLVPLGPACSFSTSFFFPGREIDFKVWEINSIINDKALSRKTNAFITHFSILLPREGGKKHILPTPHPEKQTNKKKLEGRLEDLPPTPACIFLHSRRPRSYLSSFFSVPLER